MGVDHSHRAIERGSTCRRMAWRASGDGAHVDLALRRQRSSSDERMVATTVRFNGCSGLIVLKSLAASSGESAACAALIVAIASRPPGVEAGPEGACSVVWSARTDMSGLLLFSNSFVGLRCYPLNKYVKCWV